MNIATIRAEHAIEKPTLSYRVGSLFAGIGGICLGLQQATTVEGDRYELVWANEWDERACHVYRHNFSHELLEGDIRQIMHPETVTDAIIRARCEQQRQRLLAQRIDVLTAGFPCQSFSIAGTRKGLDDPRGHLFWSIVDVIQQLGQRHERPRVVLLENVKNLKTHDGGKTYATICEQLQTLGYHITDRIVNTAHVTELPQNRERIYMVCFRDIADEQAYVWPETLKNKNDNLLEKRKKQIRTIIDADTRVDAKYYYTAEKYPHYFLSEEVFVQFSDAVRPEQRIHLEEQVDEPGVFYQLRRGMYVRKNNKHVCPTLTANMGMGGHNVPLIRTVHGIRKLTPIETLRLQGFPIGQGYSLPQQKHGGKSLLPDYAVYKQAGNAVSVPVITWIATSLLRTLTDTDRRGMSVEERF